MSHYDVAVFGGGIAGVAAALAAARRGRKTLLVEKQCVLGGLATSGLIYIYLPISDDRQRKIAGSLPEELLLKCQEYGPFSLAEKWGGPKNGNSGRQEDRCLCCFSPAGYALTLEKMVREAGVDLRLETTLVGCRCDSRNRLTEAELFCGADRECLEADCFVDATGGAFLLRMAGGKVFPETNFINPWFMEVNAQSGSAYHFTDNVYIQSLPVPQVDGSMPQVLTAPQMQEFIRRQYQAIRRYYDAMEEERRKRCYPLHLPTMPQTRKIARIDGLAEICTGEAGRFHGDSVGVAADWRKVAPAWETPYGALLPRGIGGALAAGRCINASGEAWEIFRVIPAAAMTGEAAGVAAAMASCQNMEPAVLSVEQLQQELVKNGVVLHIS